MGGPDDDVVMSFKNIGISRVHPPQQILSNVSGYIKRGTITAVMGASASGKSIFMRALTGRAQNLSVTGDFQIEGTDVDQSDLSQSVAFVPQDDILIGELSAREMIRNAAAMKKNKPMSSIDSDVDRLLSILGLSDVADNPIGTAFVRGLSGGQRKRIDIGAELVAAPQVLFLDEPTSGLDASIAYSVLSSIRDIVTANNGKLSVVLSIHQPNSRILELFDNIMLLGGGGMNFFGTVPESIQYFKSIGFPPPAGTVPTDFFLQVTDPNFNTLSNLNFGGMFGTSIYCHRLMTLLDTVQNSGPIVRVDDSSDIEKVLSLEDGPIPHGFIDGNYGQTSFWRQYFMLVSRGYTVAFRDPALYLLQFALLLGFGFMVGAVFLRLKYTVNATLVNIPASITWIVFVMAYLQIFKVYHLTTCNARYSHERANNTYGVLPAFFAELTCTSTLLGIYIPGFAVPYFMMAFPNEVFPFLIFVFWLTALTAESLCNFLSRLTTDATTNIVTSQAALVILTVFGGGLFIPWNSTPIYWVWLQELSLFTQASRAALMAVMDNIDFKCPTLPVYGMCIADIGIYPCDAISPEGEFCNVSGRNILYRLQGSSRTDSPWIAFGYLVLIFVSLRLGILILMYYPVDRIIAFIKKLYSNGNDEETLKNMINLRRVEGHMASVIAAQHDDRGAKFLRAQTVKTLWNQTDTSDELFDEVIPQLDEFTTDEHGNEQFSLAWRNISVNLKSKGTNLIDNVSGVAQSGRVLAIMGASGAGKTTLLNALGNRAPYATVTGQVTFGRRQFTPEDLYFVPQFDEVNSNFTVYEQIEIVGLLKCIDVEKMHARLTKLLVILGLQKKAKCLCNALTGGELKRVSVGMGMISNPSVLFLDEPTTGLDSTAAYSVVKHLVELAETVNVAVVITIHQPTEMASAILQDLYLIENGRLAFAGPRSCAERYFSNLGYQCPEDTGLTDFLLDLISSTQDDGNKNWEYQFLTSNYGKNVANQIEIVDRASGVAPTAHDSPSFLSRLYTLIVFNLKYYYRDRGFYYLRTYCLIVVAFFIGTIFLQLVQESQYIPRYTGVIFYGMWTVLFSAVTSTGLLVRDSRQAVEQVKNAAATPAAHCLAQLIASLPFNLLGAVVFQSIVHWLTNLHPNGEAFLYGICVTWGHLLLMEAILNTIVQVLGNAMLCVTCAIFEIGFLFLFSGFFIKIGDMPSWIRWVTYITPTKYSFDGYLYVIFHGQSFLWNHYEPYVIPGDTILLDLYGSDGIKPWPMFGTLLAWVALFRLCHYGIFTFQLMPFLSSRKRGAGADPSLEKVVGIEGRIESPGLEKDLGTETKSDDPSLQKDVGIEA